MDAVLHFLLEGKALNTDGSLLRKTEDDGSYTVFVRQPDRYISAPLRGAAEDSDDWQRITSYEEIAGVWEEIADEEESQGRYEIYANGWVFSGITENYYKKSRKEADESGDSIEVASVYAAEYSCAFMEDFCRDDAEVLQYHIGICPGYKCVTMWEVKNQDYYFVYDSYEISKDGNRIRTYNAKDHRYVAYTRQEDRYVSAVMIGEIGNP